MENPLFKKMLTFGPKDVNICNNLIVECYKIAIYNKSEEGRVIMQQINPAMLYHQPIQAYMAPAGSLGQIPLQDAPKSPDQVFELMLRKECEKSSAKFRTQSKPQTAQFNQLAFMRAGEVLNAVKPFDPLASSLRVKDDDIDALKAAGFESRPEGALQPQEGDVEAPLPAPAPITAIEGEESGPLSEHAETLRQFAEQEESQRAADEEETGEAGVNSQL